MSMGKGQRLILFAVGTAFSLGLAAGTMLAPIRESRAVSAEPEPPVSAAVAPAMPVGRYAADVMRVLDGDTFEARVHLWPGLDISTRVRLRGIDAPELRARCIDERVKAEAAREALVGILAEGEVAVGRVGLDKYGGRVLADAATRRTPNVAAAMLARGLARPYAGGRRDSWC
jgi:endonuclease YncB( thermonuclease family)